MDARRTRVSLRLRNAVSSVTLIHLAICSFSFSFAIPADSAPSEDCH